MLVSVGLWLACTMSGQDEDATGAEAPREPRWRGDPKEVAWAWEASTGTVAVCPDGTGDARTLAEGLATVPEGGVLRLCGARFTEPLVVEGSARVVGAPGTVIDALGAGSAVAVKPGGVLSLHGVVVTGGRADLGGGVTCEDGTLTLDSVVIAGNHAASGGGVALTRCRFAVRGSRFEQNVAEGAGDGGGFLARGSEGVVEDSEFVANLAHRGGGLAVDGGGVTLRRVDVRANAASRFGGGAWLQGDVDVLATRFLDNDATWSGGGLYLEGGTGTVSGSTFQGNGTLEDGAGAMLWSGSATFVDNRFLDNVAEDDAGGLRLFESRAQVEGNVFDGNVALRGDGGAIKVSHAASALTGNTYLDNTAGGSGGAVEVDDDSSTLDGERIVGNRAGGSGGGVHVHVPNWDVLLRRSWLAGNEADGCGGGFGAGPTPFTVSLEGVRLEGNHASRGGGACWAGTGTRAGATPATHVGVVEGALIVQNRADEGGGVYVGGGSVLATHATWIANTAEVGAVASLRTGALLVSEAIVVGHRASPWASTTSGTVQVDRSLGWENDASADDPLAQTGNMVAAPGFVASEVGDYALLGDSIARDAGAPACLDRDGSRCDLGWTGGAWGGLPW